MRYYKREKFWTVAKWCNPRPQYVADPKTNALAALWTMPIFGRIAETTGRWMSSHYVYDRVVDVVSNAKLRIWYAP
jgi:hypothetical protein